MLRKLRAFAAGIAASLLVLAAVPASSEAQTQPSPVLFVGEAGMSVGGTWHKGDPAPVVSSRPGVFAGLGIQRTLNKQAVGGMLVRFVTSRTRAQETGESWAGGRVLEGNLLLTLSMQMRARGAWRSSFDVHGGVNLLNGPAGMRPFRDAALIAPMAEAGVTVSRGSAIADVARQDVALFVRYNAMRVLLSSGSNGTSGMTGRMLVGARMMR